MQPPENAPHIVRIVQSNRQKEHAAHLMKSRHFCSDQAPQSAYSKRGLYQCLEEKR